MASVTMWSEERGLVSWANERKQVSEALMEVLRSWIHKGDQVWSNLGYYKRANILLREIKS